MSLIFEINGKVSEVMSVPLDGLTVGRSWDSSVVVKDRYVDPVQLRVSLQDDVLMVEDLDSSNGTEIEGKQIGGKQCAYQYGETIVLGDTILKIFDSMKEVEKTALRSRWFNAVRFFKPLYLLLLLVSFASALAAFNQWIYATEIYSFADGLSSFFQTTVGIFVIAACFATFNKLVKGFSSMREHIILVSFISIASTILVDFIAWFIRFNLQSLSIGEAVSIFIDGFVYVLLAVAALSYMTQLNKLKVWGLSIIVAIGITYNSNSDLFSKEDHEKWSKSSTTEAFALPPSFLFKEAVGLDQHLGKTGELFELADEAK